MRRLPQVATVWALALNASAMSMPAGESRIGVPDDAEAGSFILVTRDFKVQSLRLAAINDQSLVVMDHTRGWVTLDLQQCIALISIAEADNEVRTARGLVVLADGQRLPGQALIGVDSIQDSLAWSHPWLGRIDVPFRMIESVLLTPDVIAPPQSDSDVVLLANGDRQTGFVTAIGDSVSIEIAGVNEDGSATSHQMNIPLDRVTAITMIAPKQKGTGRRVWFAEGTVLDVQSIAVGDDGYVRFRGGSFATGNTGRESVIDSQAPRIGVSEVAGVLFDRDALIPLASVPPTRIEGPSTRYIIPHPQVVDPDAALGLSTLELSGPIIARFALPSGVQQLVAEAELPTGMRTWGDCDLIVRSDDEEVFRAKLNASTPKASISVPLRGRELTIELSAGAHGPIQDRVLVHRAMLLKSK